MSIEEMELFEAECKLLCYKGNMSRSNLGSFYNNEQTNWMYQMWLSSKNREGYKLVPVEPAERMLEALQVGFEPDYEGGSYDSYEGYKAMIGACDN